MKCCRCKEESIMKVMLPLAIISEIGRIVYPYETKDSSVQLPVDLCFKCMQFAEKEFINLVKLPNGEYNLTQICDEEGSWSVDFFEDRYYKGELKKDIEESLQKEKITRKEVKKQKRRSPLKVAIIIDEILDSFEKFKKDAEKEKESKR